MKVSAGKILMLVENCFPGDIRVKNEAYTLADNGYDVRVIAIHNKDDDKTVDHPRVKVYRLPQIEFFKKSCPDESGFFARFLYRLSSKVGYISEYFYFTFACLLLSIYILFKDGFDVVHAHNPPDTLFIVGGFYRLLGKKFVFDHHDLSPELYLSRYRSEKDFIYYGLLFFERMCLKLANVVIATNESYKNIEINRGKVDPENIYIVRNGPNPERIYSVSPDPELRNKANNILVYLGVIGPQDGVDYLIKSLDYLKNTLNRDDFYCVVIGKGDALQDLLSMSGEFDLDSQIEFTGFIPDEQMLKYLSTADICLDPNPSNPLNDVSTWIKVMEYMSVGKPIVSFDLRETRYTAEKAAIYVAPNDIVEYAKAIEILMDNPTLRSDMGEFGVRRVKEKLQWDIVSRNLLAAYEHLS